jgi:Cu/Ag efflux protein CusF
MRLWCSEFCCLVLGLSLAACQRMPPLQPIKEYQMQGEVISLDPSSQTETVKHRKIEGWMEAMTMEYPVKDKQAFTELKVGENIQAKIDVQGTDYWIATVNPEPAPK